jgi:hypothetical protein
MNQIKSKVRSCAVFEDSATTNLKTALKRNYKPEDSAKAQLQT